MFKEIVVLTDFSENSLRAMNTGLAWGKHLGIVPTLLHVDNLTPKLNSMSVPPAGVRERSNYENIDMPIDLAQTFDKTFQEISQSPKDWNIKVYTGGVIPKVEDYVKTNPHTLLITGGKKHDALERLFEGSTSEGLIHLENTPLMMVKDKKVQNPKNIFWATDLSTNSKKAFNWTLELAKKFNSRVKISHVITTSIYDSALVSYPMNVLMDYNIGDIIEIKQKEAEEKIEGWSEKFKKENISVEHEIQVFCHDHLANPLIESANRFNTDLLVMGHGRHDILTDLVFGSVAEKMIQMFKNNLFIVS